VLLVVCGWLVFVGGGGGCSFKDISSIQELLPTCDT